MSSVVIHAPDSFHPSLSRSELDIDALMGKWHVIFSSLPLWNDKKDVTITYTPLQPTPPSTTPTQEPLRFNDIVEYRSRSASSISSKPSRIEGIDTLLPAPPSAPADFAPAASYKWRGKGLLMIASSKWQILGYGQGWAVTYFEKTLFTPAGLDVYSRDEKGLSKELLDEITSKTKALDGVAGKLAQELFDVPRGD